MGGDEGEDVGELQVEGQSAREVEMGLKWSQNYTHRRNVVIWTKKPHTQFCTMSCSHKALGELKNAPRKDCFGKVSQDRCGGTDYQGRRN